MFQLFANLFMCILCVLCILPFMLLFASSLTNERTLIQDEKPAASVSSVKVMLILSVMTISLLAMSR